MTYGLWLSAAGLQVNDYRQSVLANNLANVDTVGFKHDLVVIRERLVESRARAANGRFAHPILNDLTGGAWVRPTITTHEQGDLDRTDAPLDLAIQGEGYFAVSNGSETRYTRDGRLTLNAAGELVLSAAQGRWHVLDTSGQPIRLEVESASEINISGDGTVRQRGGEIGRIGLVEFADRSSLSKIGRNLYQNHGGPPSPSDSQIKSGFVERSTADPIRGLTQMIEASRAYQINANLISLQDQTIGQAVGRVGRIG